MNHLYYGDNLAVLRDSIKDETVDLIYLDPPVQLQRQLQRAVQGAGGNGLCRADRGV